MSAAGAALAVACAITGVLLLRLAWGYRGGGRWRTLAGWLTLSAGPMAWHGAGIAWDKASALAALGPMVVALVILARQAQWRASGEQGARESRGVADLTKRRAELNRIRRGEVGAAHGRNWRNAVYRGVVRTILAGPVALAAALGLAALTALRAPLIEVDRLVTAGFLLPIAWAVAAIWATLDGKLIRVALVLIATALMSAGGALL